MDGNHASQQGWSFQLCVLYPKDGMDPQLVYAQKPRRLGWCKKQNRIMLKMGWLFYSRVRFFRYTLSVKEFNLILPGQSNQQDGSAPGFCNYDLFL